MLIVPALSGSTWEPDVTGSSILYSVPPQVSTQNGLPSTNVGSTDEPIGWVIRAITTTTAAILSYDVGVGVGVGGGEGDRLGDGEGAVAGSPLTTTLSTRALSGSSSVSPQKRISMLVPSAVMPRAASTYVAGQVVVSLERSCVLTVVQLPAAESFHCTTRSPSSLPSRSVSWPQSYSRWMFTRPVVSMADFVAIPPLRRRRYLSPVP